MAGMPPGGPGLGAVMPPRPPMGPPPGTPPMMPPPPPMGGPPPIPPPGVGGLGANSPMGSMLSDLPAHLPDGWQAIDLSIRALRTAMRSVAFQKTPAIVAVVQSATNTLSTLLSHYTSGTAGGQSADGTADVPNSTSSDADNQPRGPGEEMSGSDENQT